MLYEDYEQLIPPAHRYPREKEVITKYELVFNRDGSLKTDDLPRDVELWLHLPEAATNVGLSLTQWKQRLAYTPTTEFVTAHSGMTSFEISIRQGEQGPYSVNYYEYLTVNGHKLTSETIPDEWMHVGINTFECDGYPSDDDFEVTWYVPTMEDYEETTRIAGDLMKDPIVLHDPDFAGEEDTGSEIIVYADPTVGIVFSKWKKEYANDAYFYTVGTKTGERSDFAEMVRACVRQGIDFCDLLDGFLMNFDLDLAVGKQLDFIGAIVGASRNLPYMVIGSNGLLEDDDYRLLIQARIAMNTWDGTNEGLASLLKAVYKDFNISVRDNQDMSMTYVISGKFSDLQKQMIQGDLIFPRPAGVSMEAEFVDTFVATDIYADSRLAGEFQSAGMKKKAT